MACHFPPPSNKHTHTHTQSICAELNENTSGEPLVSRQIVQMVLVTILYSLLETVPKHVVFSYNSFSVREQFPLVIEA